VKIVLLEDVSAEADAILAKSEIASIAERTGKRVAYEEGTTGEVLLRYALQENGLTIDDVEKVPLSATEAGPAVIAGRVDAAYTYEPFVSAALKRGDGLKALYTAAEKPGIISDVLLVRQEVIDDRPGQVAALVRSWQAGLDAYEADPDGSQATIAEDLGTDLAELKDAFSGIEFYDVARNRQEASSGQLAETVQIVADVAEQAGLIEGDVDVEALIESRFVNAGS